ncbi:EamA family transporter RarD [Campylobacter sp. 19-13652]|uniref:EamA family transporter RarD n=1 Tax=Campylobacter sp. 19-13652 TaxID=2840180 RepID=UPI001C774754|nr:EamA family transporter RarD [Campylobacter sp. 19-13652]BCX79478.1 putative RarD protein [Campylobacter sp. 19-13652]
MIQNSTKLGYIYAATAFIMWGIFPAFFKLFPPEIGALEILAARIFFSIFLLAFIIIVLKHTHVLKALFGDSKKRFGLFVGGILISVNWGVFIYAVALGQIVQTSLGYFINPLMSILLGVVVLGERLGRAGLFATFLVAVAIGVQIVAAGELPMVSLVLPLSFALYGLNKKRLNVGSLEGLFVETVMLLPFVVGYGVYLYSNGNLHFGLDYNGFLLAFSGVITVLPLLAFGAASTRISLSSIGYMQYISPTISLLLAVYVYHESVYYATKLSFGLIWLALIIAFGAKAKR